MASSLKLGGYVNRPGGVDGAVIENNTFDLGVASDTLTGQPSQSSSTRIKEARPRQS